MVKVCLNINKPRIFKLEYSRLMKNENTDLGTLSNSFNLWTIVPIKGKDK